MIKSEILNPSLETIGEEIGQELGAKMVKDFQDKYPNDTNVFYIGRNIIDEILAQPGCVGIRYYMGLNEIGEKTLVYVGIDSFNQIINEYKIIDNEGKLSNKQGIVADRSNNGGGGVKTSTSTTTWSWSD
ncbi:hypothetical protein [Flavihumibacter fluvii]|uniref:hypothetical protein n=1 Tax=Flavihumibacter fluvii TaxID=2838157 RepID=UPI001BDEBFD1|nr:hypothetical protein [Flavihumibacter fluvii]ULQ52892.1 hypothetical protein KJS93_00995 [Flavihumibacter fluvii]